MKRSYVLAGLVLVGCAGAPKPGPTGQGQELTTTTDFGDAVATSSLDEESHWLLATLTDAEQTSELLSLAWNLEDGSVELTLPDGPTYRLDARDVRLEQTPTPELANSIVYEQWRAGDDAFSCYCVGWDTWCSPVYNCGVQADCGEVCSVYNGEQSCETQCHMWTECWESWTCYAICTREACWS